VVLAVVLLAAAATLPGAFGGPALGDHETLVVQCARNMRLSGDWIVPRFLDVPWTRKPPLPYWIVAGVSYLFPNEPHTGLPVPPAAGRFVSGLAGLGTILLLWKMAAVMFGRRAGVIAAVISSSSLLFFKYSPDATVEMPLTFCCVWAYLHFWLAVTARRSGRRILHLALFYLALGVGMMVKGPAPVAMVGLPLAVWWYLHRPLRILAWRGPGAWKQAAWNGLRGWWPRTRRAFSRLWLIPGLLLFAAVFVPWTVAAARRAPQAALEWRWQYFMRAKGDYLDSQDRPVWYYLPLVAGLTLPWLFLLPEAVAAPWLKRYRRLHGPLLYCGLWTLTAVAVMSLEPFKKPYYIVPALPGLLLMMAAVADRFYGSAVGFRTVHWLCWGAGVVVVGAGAVAGTLWVRQVYPEVSFQLSAVLAGVGVLAAAAAAVHLRGRPWTAMGLLAGGAVAAFHVVWFSAGHAFDSLERVEALAAALDRAGVPPDARVLWADGRPDARLDYYFARKSAYMIRPDELLDVQDRKQDKFLIQMRVLKRAGDLLAGTEPVFLIWERGNYRNALNNSPIGGRIIAAVPRGEERKDWVVVTNAAVAAAG
jgi:4-amino-4-deoxy-L-arabinose transferase-like glycosyltransferase